MTTVHRSLMYTRVHLANKRMEEIEADLSRIGSEYGVCDLVIANIDAGVSDERARTAIDRYSD